MENASSLLESNSYYVISEREATAVLHRALVCDCVIAMPRRALILCSTPPHNMVRGALLSTEDSSTFSTSPPLRFGFYYLACLMHDIRFYCRRRREEYFDKIIKNTSY